MYVVYVIASQFVLVADYRYTVVANTFVAFLPYVLFPCACGTESAGSWTTKELLQRGTTVSCGTMCDVLKFAYTLPLALFLVLF